MKIQKQKIGGGGVGLGESGWGGQVGAGSGWGVRVDLNGEVKLL